MGRYVYSLKSTSFFILELKLPLKKTLYVLFGNNVLKKKNPAKS
ncbi:hypothetical protein Catovirus_1_588 [Catovirus CTV1]|uniref:Uncharacterized protein n=1 Tax=Catovirus CTV1 TaxID=1977631 RepID=A0A1V0SA57_9VIRU|nr:hypothetical protein Catovirus_1_588 [Catovirus CTV1]